FDLDHDGAATNKDLQALIGDLANSSFSPTIVPEPKSFELAVISCIGIAGYVQHSRKRATRLVRRHRDRAVRVDLREAGGVRPRLARRSRANHRIPAST